MHRLMASAVVLALAAGVSCQTEQDLEKIRDYVLGEFDKSLDQRVKKLREDMRKELATILDQAAEVGSSTSCSSSSNRQMIRSRRPKRSMICRSARWSATG